MPALLTFMLSKTGWAVMAAVGLLALFGVQEVRLKLAEHGKASAEATVASQKAAVATAGASLKTSEARRAVEASQAVAAVSDAETACAARVAEARRSAGKIRSMVEKPVALDPTTHCPARMLRTAPELRDALGLGG